MFHAEYIFKWQTPSVIQQNGKLIFSIIVTSHKDCELGCVCDFVQKEDGQSQISLANMSNLMEMTCRMCYLYLLTFEMWNIFAACILQWHIWSYATPLLHRAALQCISRAPSIYVCLYLYMCHVKYKMSCGPHPRLFRINFRCFENM